MAMTHRKSFGSYISAKFEGRDQLKRVIANSGWLFADKLIRMGVGLAVAVWIARYLGVKQFGQLNFAIAFASLFTALATLGLDLSLPALLLFISRSDWIRLLSGS